MKPLHIPSKALILVGDGRKALLLRNRGTAQQPQLAVETAFAQDNPPMREQVSDRAGRTAFGPQHRHGGLDKGDWHEFAEAEFAQRVAETVTHVVRGENIADVIVVAPARTLAVLRDNWPKDIAERIVAELAKDLTRHPVPDILQHLTP